MAWLIAVTDAIVAVVQVLADPSSAASVGTATVEQFNLPGTGGPGFGDPLGGLPPLIPGSSPGDGGDDGAGGAGPGPPGGEPGGEPGEPDEPPEEECPS